MQINLDPTRWLVSFVGFVTDWMLTRDWKRIGLNSIPLMLLATVGVLVFCGSRLDKHKLASRYLALGEKEIAEWEQSWAPSKPADSSKEKTSSPAEKATENTPEKTVKKELSPFAEVLFRRVQLLEPNEKSQFVIAITMAQRGATSQAEKMLAKIAPDNRPGYAPAHAWIAQNLFQQPITDNNVKLVTHHVKEAVKWDRVPEALLLVGSELFRSLKPQDRQSCLDLLKRAAELNPANGRYLTERSVEFDNKVLAESSSARTESYFRGELERNPNDLKSRIGLLQTLFAMGKLTEAEEVIRTGMQIEPAPELTRGLSEVFRLRYRTSLKRDGETWSGDLQMLDAAMRTDPTNPMVVEEIARLARLNGKSPGDDLIKTLQQFLAEGKATAATHAWISELYLIRKDYARALPYLEQVVSRLPNQPQYLNNLAYVLDEIAPARREEALALAQRAVQLEPRSADYYDTLAKVLAGLDRRTEAITALESAIERQPSRKDFHERIAALYQATDNTQMAEQHRLISQRIAEFEAKAAIAQAEAEKTEKAKAASESPSPDATAPEAATPEVAAPATTSDSDKPAN